jgi:hypothetical protein
MAQDVSRIPGDLSRREAQQWAAEQGVAIKEHFVPAGDCHRCGFGYTYDNLLVASDPRGVYKPGDVLWDGSLLVCTKCGGL